MTRISPAARSASSGELSSLMYGRPDFVRYQNGARACRGFIPLPEGPVTRIPGTELIGELAGGGTGRLMAFVFRDEDAMLLEWTGGKLRFWRNDALVTKLGGVYELATIYTQPDVKRLQSLQSADRIYLVEGARHPQRLSRKAVNDWSIENTPFINGPFKSQNIDQNVELGVSAAVGAVTVTSSADLFVAGHTGALFRLREIDSSDTPQWTGETKIAINEQVYNGGRLYRVIGFDAENQRTASTAPTINAAGAVSASGSVVWASVAQNNAGGVPAWSDREFVRIGDRRFTGGWTIEVIAFDADDKTTGVNPPFHTLGRALSEKGGVVWQMMTDGSGIVEITAITNPRTALGIVRSRLPDGLTRRPTYRWNEGAWSGKEGWPRAIGAFQQRHIYGGTPMEPRTLWFTVIGGTVDMSAGGLDDDGFSYILESNRQRNGEIKTITGSGGTVHIGTSGDEFFGSSTDADRAFGEQTSKFQSDSSHGCADTVPAVIDGTPLFIHKNRRRMMALSVDPNSGRFQGENLTQIARHILGPGVDRIVYQEEPVPIVWARGLDGALVGLTYIAAQQVVGWHRHDPAVLAGGFVEDIEVLPTSDGLSEALYMIVRRTINGVTKRFIEKMKPPFVDLDGTALQLKDAWFQFCAKRYNGAPTQTIGNLSHLEGQTVTCWTEIGAFPDLIVQDGLVTLPRAVVSAITGLDGTAAQRFDGLDMVAGTPDGGDDGRLRTHRVTGVRYHQTSDGEFAIVGTKDGEEAETYPQPIFNVHAFQDPKLRNGVFEIAGQKGWDHQTFMRFRPKPGAPLTVVARTPTLMMTDD